MILHQRRKRYRSRRLRFDCGVILRAGLYFIFFILLSADDEIRF